MKNLVLILSAAIIAIGCNHTPTKSEYITIEGFAEGTTYRIVYQDSLKRDIQTELTSFFTDFEKSLSIYDPQSLVSRLNGGDSTIKLDKWFIECFNLSQSISQKSDGLLDPTLCPLITAYGFGGKVRVRDITQNQIDSMLCFVGYEKVTIRGDKLIKDDPRTELDFNAIAKGYSVDLIGRMMDSLQIKNYLIEVGGEIFCRGVNSRGTEWRVAIDTPEEGNFIPGADTKATISISGKGLATSGNYRKFRLDENGEKVVHTIDPRTGKPSIHTLLSATIVAPTCGEADGFATACMVAGLEGAKKIIAANPEIEALLIYSEGGEMKIFASPEMQKRITIQE